MVIWRLAKNGALVTCHMVGIPKQWLAGEKTHGLSGHVRFKEHPFFARANTERTLVTASSSLPLLRSCRVVAQAPVVSHGLFLQGSGNEVPIEASANSKPRYGLARDID